MRGFPLFRRDIWVATQATPARKAITWLAVGLIIATVLIPNWIVAIVVAVAIVIGHQILGNHWANQDAVDSHS